MSVERVKRQGGIVWRVRWREGGRNRSRVLGRKRDAEAFDAELRRRKRAGELALLDAGTETLSEFAERWWAEYARPRLAANTLRTYAMLFDRHILHALGGQRLRDIRPEDISRLAAELAERGLSPATQLAVIGLVHNLLQRALEWRLISQNPAALIRKPARRRQRSPKPLAPATVERIRGHLLASSRRRAAANRLADATLISVLAYAGLRPGEALALAWGHLRERTIHVERAVALGQFKETKTGGERTVRLLVPLAQDLREYRLARGQPGPADLLFPGPDGGPWKASSWRWWTETHWRPAADASGAGGARAYDLRHSFVSLLIHEGVSVLDIARQAGHSATMTLNTYGHLFDEFDPADRQPAEQLILSARNELVPVVYPRPLRIGA